LQAVSTVILELVLGGSASWPLQVLLLSAHWLLAALSLLELLLRLILGVELVG